MKIVKIGGWDGYGWPVGWTFDCENSLIDAAMVIGEASSVETAGLDIDVLSGVVSVNGVEIVEWTQARNEAMTAFLQYQLDATGRLYVPPGTYRLTRPLRVTGPAA